VKEAHSGTPPAVTLQVNLCAGDAAYAHQTVPRLLAIHPRVASRLAIVDCCRPQRTRIFDPDTRVPPDRFRTQLAEIRAIAAEFRRQGLFDRVEFLEPGDARFASLARRFARPWMTDTHDYGGCAFMAYWAALDFPTTPFVLHYDADMLVYAERGCDWADDAIGAMASLPNVVAATPRISPPGFARHLHEDAPSLHEGRPRMRVDSGWLNDWFSTRCFLIDRARLEPHLPLVRARQAGVFALRRIIDRGYPPGPEHLLHRRLGGHGLRCLHLADTGAWLLHPTRKTGEFLTLLPGILAAVQKGEVPPAQVGHADLRLEAWQTFLRKPAT